MRLKEFLKDGGRKYTDPYYDAKDKEASEKTGVPLDILRSIRLKGERSNENQVSSAGARGVYQFIPSVRNSVIKKYGVDAWKPEEASLAAAYLLKENAQRNNNDYTLAVREYHGGVDRNNWGKINQSYVNRVFGNNSESPIDNLQYSKFDMSIFDKMREGLATDSEIYQAYQKAPQFTEMMITNINTSRELAEKQRLEQEKLTQEQQQKMVEQENEQIQLALQQKIQERQQMISMIPQAQSVSQGTVIPKIGF